MNGDVVVTFCDSVEVEPRESVTLVHCFGGGTWHAVIGPLLCGPGWEPLRLRVGLYIQPLRSRGDGLWTVEGVPRGVFGGEWIEVEVENRTGAVARPDVRLTCREVGPRVEG